jgi:glucokinase
VTVGTGLGGGVMLAGDLLRHTGECAGDLGHIILDPNGRRCTCGAHGCFEALVCSAALIIRAGGKLVRDVVRDANAGDQGALNAIGETAKWLGVGLASLAPLFAPDTIVVGGGVAAAGDLLLEPVRASFRVHAGDDFRDRVRINGSTLGGWEGMIGAASLFLDPIR